MRGGGAAVVADEGGGLWVTSPLLDQLTDFINLLLSGVPVPPEVRTILFGSFCTVLTKKGGGMRPIAVGVTWRRLAAKVCVHQVSERAATSAWRHNSLGLE